MDFEAVVIDGVIPTAVKKRSISEVHDQPEKTDFQGMLVPKAESGQIGQNARTAGAAAAPMSADYPIDQDRLLRIDAALRVAVVKPNRGECQLSDHFWRGAGYLSQWSGGDENHDSPAPAAAG
ncbi:MAG: hypothetical protein OXF88_08360 [Rhodobacteraceae bacterium]|nr:hypothetical protein [Paracoccaceae bacterium]MCY4140014.1 hypothetical protein [Paracoccaceae bacterium]